MKSSAKLRSSARSGFTLIELTITMLILIVLAGVAVPQFSNVADRAQDNRRITDLVTIEKALEQYKADNGAYPDTGGAWRGDAPNYGGLGYDAVGYIPGLVPDYMKELPRDPNQQNPTGSRGYLYRSNGTDFKFLAHQTPNDFPTDHRFFDPRRPTWAYQVSSPTALATW